MQGIDKMENNGNLLICGATMVLPNSTKIGDLRITDGIISEIADQVFNRSINITNELVNRNKLSGNAIRASKQLLYDIINHEGLPDLGYKSFPAERGLFESILKSHGVYSKNKNKYNVSLQKQSKDPVARQISTLFGVTMEHLESNRDKSITHWGWRYPASNHIYVEEQKKSSHKAVMRSIVKLLKAYEDNSFPTKYNARTCSYCSYLDICDGGADEGWL